MADRYCGHGRLNDSLDEGHATGPADEVHGGERLWIDASIMRCTKENAYGLIGVGPHELFKFFARQPL